MARSIFLIAGIAAYAIFFATFLYLIGFVGDAPIIPVTIDRGPSTPTGSAFAIDLGLIAMFGAQHSIMARPAFKAGWTRIVPQALERSGYVLFSSLALIVMFLLWRPIEQPIWAVGGIGAATLWVMFAAGWGIVLLSTFLINHFELFGLQQVWLNLRGGAAADPHFRTPLFYRLVRHPLYTGFLLAFWSTPAMTLGHLVFAIGMTIYIVIAIGYEERDLLKLFGEDYATYRTRTGMLVPGIGRARP